VRTSAAQCGGIFGTGVLLSISCCRVKRGVLTALSLYQNLPAPVKKLLIELSRPSLFA
jgi:hypothetical protein